MSVDNDKLEISMSNKEINYKDLTKKQLETLKELYIVSRIDSMSEEELRQFAREIIQVQVRGAVGNEEEREVWKEMKEHFDPDFETKIKEVLKDSAKEEISPEQKEFERRLDLLEQQKKEKDQSTQDMW